MIIVVIPISITYKLIFQGWSGSGRLPRTKFVNKMNKTGSKCYQAMKGLSDLPAPTMCIYLRNYRTLRFPAQIVSLFADIDGKTYRFLRAMVILTRCPRWNRKARRGEAASVYRTGVTAQKSGALQAALAWNRSFRAVLIPNFSQGNPSFFNHITLLSNHLIPLHSNHINSCITFRRTAGIRTSLQ